jgi:hypothetical protein
MACTACLVCLISTVSGRFKKAKNAFEDVVLVAGTIKLKQSIFLDICGFQSDLIWTGIILLKSELIMTSHPKCVF